MQTYFVDQTCQPQNKTLISKLTTSLIKLIKIASKTREWVLPETGKSVVVSFLQPSFSGPDRFIKIDNLGKVSGLLCQLWSAAGQQVIIKAVVCTYITIKGLG